MTRLKSKDLRAWRDKRREAQCNIDPITQKFIENPCADHDHATGHLRQVLDRETNAFEGKVFNAWRRYLRYKGVSLLEAISGLYGYYVLDYSKNPVHPMHRTKEEKKELRNKRARLKRRKAKK